ncbi:MAG: glycosyltransferase [Sulfuritalea sp.]|nr:glycosyltransferase [Sulfuritalea sp.]
MLPPIQEVSNPVLPEWPVSPATRLSVVIATLGGDSLQATIDALNRASVVPAEILVCIPEHEAPRVASVAGPNVRAVITPCRGQVAQRAAGFREAVGPLVMQMDDDMLVAPDCVERLVETLAACGPKVAIAPALVDLHSGRPVYRKPDRPVLLQMLYYWLVNASGGYEPGKINRAGDPVGIDPGAGPAEQRIHDVEWLPGGCVMHFRPNLVLDDFFPFAGKAFCEDLIHSCHLRRKGVRLLVDAAAVCKLETFYESSCGVREFSRNLRADFRARRYFMQLSERRTLRMYLFYLARVVSYLAKRLARPVVSQFGTTNMKRQGR